LKVIIYAMPGPGPHMMYAMGSGLCLTTVSNGRFSPHHTFIYAINSFFGPDIGSFSEWLVSLFGGHTLASTVADYIHHPFYYIIILGYPLCLLYSRISSFLLHKHFLDSSLSKVFDIAVSFHHLLLLLINNFDNWYCRCHLLRCNVCSWYLLALRHHFFLDHL